MENQKPRPKVGVGVLIVKEGKVLFGKRKGAHGAGSWCFPGGHLEFMEKVEDCAKRETLEEAGVKIKNISYVTITEDMGKAEGEHYITVFVMAEWESGEAKVMEPDKCEGWGWFEWDKPPKPLFIAQQNLYKKGFRPAGL